MRTVKISKAMAAEVANLGKDLEVISQTPHDRAGCECEALLERHVSMKSLGMPVPALACPRNKEGMKRYYIKCKLCDSDVSWY